MSRKAKAQWSDPKSRETIYSGICEKARTLRTRFSDLTWDSFKTTKLEDGRFYTTYWDEDERKRCIYRYQWVWIVHNGPIPKGCHVHHKNDDCTDDRLENLQVLTQREHLRLHMDEDLKRKMLAGAGKRYTKKTEYTCRACGEKFERYPRGGTEARKFCSPRCYHVGMVKQ